MPIQQPEWWDPHWAEASDTSWRRGLRLQQGWWRVTHTGLDAGHVGGRQRPVLSMLPDGADLHPNLMTHEARMAATKAIANLRTSRRPGIIDEDRLRRNLLSSQPLCFNLFGYLCSHPEALLPWVRTLASTAVSVERIELEWAPKSGALGGSAFDAYVEFTNADDSRGFLGVECKYAEDLAASQRQRASTKYVSETHPPLWTAGAAEVLDQHRLRQLWYNQLLVQRVGADCGFADSIGVVVACRADEAASRAAETVASQLAEPDRLQFSAIEDILASVRGHAAWQEGFATRYLDFAPIQHLLPPNDPRRHS